MRQIKIVNNKITEIVNTSTVLEGFTQSDAGELGQILVTDGFIDDSTQIDPPVEHEPVDEEKAAIAEAIIDLETRLSVLEASASA